MNQNHNSFEQAHTLFPFISFFVKTKFIRGNTLFRLKIYFKWILIGSSRRPYYSWTIRLQLIDN